MIVRFARIIAGSHTPCPHRARTIAHRPAPFGRSGSHGTAAFIARTTLRVLTVSLAPFSFAPL
jgi:hypothetical protein